ncbi:MAG: endonuclease [Candidatus Cloacimonetes bacterium]|nr:endonuclease [Candidatus Cloacimonadota bacterium]
MLKLYYIIWHLHLVFEFFIKAYLIQVFSKDPISRRRRQAKNTSRTAKKLLKAFRIDLEIKNPEALQLFQKQNYLVIANHVSYLDIIILASLHDLIFITSVEMGANPFLGKITHLGGSLFTDRKRFVSLPGEIKKFSQSLREGFSLVLFPEGTSTNGEKFNDFRKSLFQTAILAQKPLLPICIKYKRIQDQPITIENRDIVCWYGDMTFMPHYMKLVTKKVSAELHILNPIEVSPDSNRQELCEQCYQQLSTCYFFSPNKDNIMKKNSLLGFLIMILWISTGFADYYDNVINLTGQELYYALRNLISTNTNSDYSGARIQLFGYLDNNNGVVRCIYTGQDWSVPQGTTPNYNLLNTEHTYAQSWFTGSEESVKKADLHHLFPTNAQVNSARGNLPFDIIPNHSSATSYVSYNNYHSYRGANQNSYTVFEPADQSKGNIARALLYFNTRYNNTLTQQNVDMIPTLLIWHVLDPVDNIERARNISVQAYQSNRNPYIDHPEFVQRIWGPTTIEDATISSNLTLGRPYPNPFTSSLTLPYTKRSGADGKITIYNVRGQKVNEFELLNSIGNYELTWDGRDSRGASCPQGLYLLKATQDTGQYIRKIIKLSN